MTALGAWSPRECPARVHYVAAAHNRAPRLAVVSNPPRYVASSLEKEAARACAAQRHSAVRLLPCLFSSNSTGRE